LDVSRFAVGCINFKGRNGNTADKGSIGEGAFEESWLTEREWVLQRWAHNQNEREEEKGIIICKFHNILSLQECHEKNGR
jgi:hypothetical protein